MQVCGRGVFVTGGAQGIGRCMTVALLDKGARVLFCDVDSDKGKATEQELQKQHGAEKVAFAPCDVTDANQLDGAFQAAVKKFGAVEICVNNAAILNDPNFEKVIAVNTTAQIRGSEMAFEHMRRDKGGRGGVIINTVSTGGLSRNCHFPVYIASKHAMIGYTTSRAADPDMPALGVRWSCLCPCVTDTRMTDLHYMRQVGVKDPDQVFERNKGRLMRPEEVAGALVHQIEDVSNNGQILVVDHDRGAVYRHRVLVDQDGVSHPVLVDTPLPHHPPVPGHSQ